MLMPPYYVFQVFHLIISVILSEQSNFLKGSKFTLTYFNWLISEFFFLI